MLHSPRILSGPEFECLVPLRDLVDCVVFRGGVDLAHGFDEIGDGPLVLTPDHKYFYFYFPDWPAGTTTTSNVSVARAPANSVLEAAFGSSHPHTVAFEKIYQGNWHLRPGIGGASSSSLS